MDELVAPKQCALMAVASVWMVPISYISHVRCYLQLAKLLASHGIAVTLFCTKDDSDRLHAAEPKMCESWKLDGLDLRLRLFYIQQPPELADGENGPERLVTLIRDQEQALKIILTNEAQLGHSRPSCVISDPWLPGVRVRGHLSLSVDKGNSCCVLPRLKIINRSLKIDVYATVSGPE